jgi:hypothetical protein
MIQGLDPLGGSTLRHEPIYLEGRGPIAQPETARALGLPATQVVGQAPAAVGGQVHHPTAPTAMPGLSPQAALATLASAPQPPRYTLGDVFASLQAVAAGGSAGGSEVIRLMQATPQWVELLRLIHSLMRPSASTGGTGAGGSGTGSEAGQGWTAALLSPAWPLRPERLPRMGALSAEGLRQAMAAGGWATEALVLARDASAGQDIKAIMRRLLRMGTAVGSEAAASSLSRSVDTLERGQLESLSAQLQGQLLLQFVIPFGDAGPVALRIFRDRPRQDEPDPEFIVDMHARHTGLGPVWLRTAVQGSQRVALAMWAESAEVVVLARTNARDLRYLLQRQGLQLVAFDIHEGPRPQREDVFAAKVEAP